MKARASQDERAAAMLRGVRDAGLKLTHQRMCIIRELSGDDSHPTAQELFDRLRPTLPTMSFATVYNTLDALRSSGLCVALSLSPGSGRFDPNMTPHHHAVCDGCGSVRDIPFTESEVPAKSPAALRALDFKLRSVERIFRGRCARCVAEAPPKTKRLV